MTTDEDQTTVAAGEAGAEPVPADESPAAPHDAAEVRHPYRERFLAPFVIPLLVIVGIIVFVLNVSRIFIASAGTGAVIIAVVITLSILFGAAALSAAPRMRSSSVGLIIAGALVVITGAGWLTIGAAEEHGEEEVVLGEPIDSQVVDALPSLAFDPPDFELAADPAGGVSVSEITLHNVAAGQHNITFEDPNVVWTVPVVNAADENATEVAGFPEAADYVYYCSVPGHREAGMEGLITVSPDVAPEEGAGGGGEGGGDGGGAAGGEGGA
jgi:plastocyanin